MQTGDSNLARESSQESPPCPARCPKCGAQCELKLDKYHYEKHICHGSAGGEKHAFEDKDKK